MINSLKCRNPAWFFLYNTSHFMGQIAHNKCLVETDTYNTYDQSSSDGLPGVHNSTVHVINDILALLLRKRIWMQCYLRPSSSCGSFCFGLCSNLVRNYAKFHIAASMLLGRMRPENRLVNINCFAVWVVQKHKKSSPRLYHRPFHSRFQYCLAQSEIICTKILNSC